MQVSAKKPSQALASVKKALARQPDAMEPGFLALELYAAGIAEAEDLPRAYLEQIVGSLRDAGIIDSQRGAHGGYRLARPANELHMGEVLRALEGPIVPMSCLAEVGSPCNRAGSCTVAHLWSRVRDAVATALDSFTLADLAKPGSPIALKR